ncbi:MAG: hypothetical protein VYE77_10010 [Planctomycetota bacterium]|nr:hypothetical protein [Planctomycetota bacterium]
MTNASDERFADWMDGEMSPRERERFEAEMQVNPALRARAEEYRRTTEQVRQALRAPGPKVDIADRVFAEIAASGKPFRDQSAQSQPVPWGAVSGRSMMLSAAVAAAILVTLVLLPEWQQEPDGDPQAKTAGPPSALAPDAQNLAFEESADGSVAMDRLIPPTDTPDSVFGTSAKTNVEGSEALVGAAAPPAPSPPVPAGREGAQAQPKSGKGYGGREGAGALREQAPSVGEERASRQRSALGAGVVDSERVVEGDAAVVLELRQTLLGRDADAKMLPVLRFSLTPSADEEEVLVAEAEVQEEGEAGGVEVSEANREEPATGSTGVVDPSSPTPTTELFYLGQPTQRGRDRLASAFAIPAEELGASVQIRTLTADPSRALSADTNRGGEPDPEDPPAGGLVAGRVAGEPLGLLGSGQALVIEGALGDVEQFLAKLANAARSKGYSMSSSEAPQEVVSFFVEAEAQERGGKLKKPTEGFGQPAGPGSPQNQAAGPAKPFSASRGVPAPAAPQAQGNPEAGWIRLVLVIEDAAAPAAGKSDEKPRKR